MTTRLRTNKILAIIFTVVIISAILPFSAVDTVYADGTFNISAGDISINWDGSDWLVNGTPVANSENDPIIITGYSYQYYITVDGGDSPTAPPLYIQIESLTINYNSNNSSLTIDGGANVYLSLVDTNNLGSITVMSDSAITINGSGNLTAFEIGQEDNVYKGCGAITINSGTINVFGPIGNGFPVTDEVNGTITINGGTISARGIGNYNNNSTITITGGEVTSSGYQGTGIGSTGYLASSRRSSVVITITGGTVIATGYTGCAGIGGARRNSNCDITIGGDANVTAIGGDGTKLNSTCAGAGIGNSDDFIETVGNITISGNATVKAIGGNGVHDNFNGPGIGFWGGTGANITIDGATVSAQAGSTPGTVNKNDIYTDGDIPGTLSIDGGALVTLEKLGAQPNAGSIGECVIIDSNTSVDYTNLTGTYYSLSVTDGTAAFTSNSSWKTGIVKSGTPITLTAAASPSLTSVFSAWTYSPDTASCFTFAAGDRAASNPADIVPSQTSVRPATFRLAFAATFVPTYTVTFDSRSGSYVAPITGILANNSITKPSSPTRDGYTFSGWYKDAACTIPWDFATDTVNSDITLYAKWNSTQTAPKTGDTASSAMWILLLGIALVCMAAAVVLRKRNNLFAK